MRLGVTQRAVLIGMAQIGECDARQVARRLGFTEAQVQSSRARLYSHGLVEPVRRGGDGNGARVWRATDRGNLVALGSMGEGQ